MELGRIGSYLGKSLHDPELATPAAVIDFAAARQNFQRMLDACKDLDLGLRVDVKSHKSYSLARLQYGMAGPARITVSTLREAEELGNSMRGAAAEGREVDVMYGLPVGRGDVKTLASLASAQKTQGCKPGEFTPLTVSVLIDDPEQLRYLGGFKELSGESSRTCTSDSNRAGVWHYSDRFKQVADAALEAHARGDIVLSGLYAHTSHAMYKAQGDRDENLCEAMFYLARQFYFMMSAAGTILRRAEDRVVALDQKPLVLSASLRCVGVLEVLEALNDIEHGKNGDEDDSSTLQNEAAELLWVLRSIRSSGFMTPEIHAGSGYAMMDLQQLAVSQGLSTPTSWGDLALTILAEVRSVYPGQGEDGKSLEALIGAGALALGKERSEESFGWGVVTPWGRKRRDDAHIPGGRVASSLESKTDQSISLGELEGWIVGTMSMAY